MQINEQDIIMHFECFATRCCCCYHVILLLQHAAACGAAAATGGSSTSYKHMSCSLIAAHRHSYLYDVPMQSYTMWVYGRLHIGQARAVLPTLLACPGAAVGWRF
jgi:hypothetical protein